MSEDQYRPLFMLCNANQSYNSGPLRDLIVLTICGLRASLMLRIRRTEPHNLCSIIFWRGRIERPMFHYFLVGQATQSVFRWTHHAADFQYVSIGRGHLVPLFSGLTIIIRPMFHYFQSDNITQSVFHYFLGMIRTFCPVFLVGQDRILFQYFLPTMFQYFYQTRNVPLFLKLQ